jgi:hypothetical protein
VKEEMKRKDAGVRKQRLRSRTEREGRKIITEVMIDHNRSLGRG